MTIARFIQLMNEQSEVQETLAETENETGFDFF